jgi:hypothetical protein
MRHAECMRLAAFTLWALAAVAFAQSTLAVLDEFDALPQLPGPQRAQLLGNAAQWERWTVDERAAYARRAVEWDAQSMPQRGARRERYLAWIALPAEEQAQVRAAIARFAALPPEQQATLRAQFAALDGSAQRGWLLGPVLGAGYPSLHPLLAQLPVEQHAPLLRLLRAMTSRQRTELALLAQRTPPQDRAKLRSELLSTSASNRDAWLQLQLER